MEGIVVKKLALGEKLLENNHLIKHVNDIYP